MAECIEREKTVELLRSLGNREYRKEKGTIQDAIKMISYPEYTPTADVAPVVRCKDCKHLCVWNRKDIYAFCPKTNIVFLPFDKDTRTFFCSLGERKDGGDG